MTPEYDYVIAGGGAAGCALAARLAADPAKRVLLVEAGGRGRSLFITMPAGNGFLFEHPKYDWSFHSVPQPGLHGRRVYYPRGRSLGGSTLMNGMIYMRGNPRDYDAWRQRGLAGWAYRDLLPYFKRSEGSGVRSDPYHGLDGPLRTSRSVNFTPIDRVFVDAARQAGAPDNPDFNGASQIGVGRMDVTVEHGRRMSAARAYLRQRPANLSVRTETRVLGVALEGRRAIGLRVAARGGTTETIRAEREVVLSLGAFMSPHALMLSGLGPADHLRHHGIAPVLDLPGVGQNLKDHLNVPVRYACADERLSLARHQRLDRALLLGLRYLLGRSGPGASPFWSACLFESLGDDPALPDLQIFFTPMVFSEAITEADGRPANSFSESLNRLGARLFARGKRVLSGFQFDINQMRPDACGEVRLAGPDPRQAPRIDPRFLSEAKERTQLVAGVRRVREIVSQRAFDGVRGAEISPGEGVATDAGIAEAVAASALTGHHPVGTCKMGIHPDPMAVVDAELRVRGIEHLRVVDASVFPSQVTGNTNAVVIAIAEKAADLILGRPAPPPEDPD